METKRFSIMVSGKVQGVGFRHFTKENARKHGLSGWVRNTADGKVQIEVQGIDGMLQLFVADIRKGPLLSKVLGVESHELPLIPGDKTFVVKY